MSSAKQTRTVVGNVGNVEDISDPLYGSPPPPIWRYFFDEEIAMERIDLVPDFIRRSQNIL